MIYVICLLQMRTQGPWYGRIVIRSLVHWWYGRMIVWLNRQVTGFEVMRRYDFISYTTIRPYHHQAPDAVKCISQLQAEIESVD